MGASTTIEWINGVCWMVGMGQRARRSLILYPPDTIYKILAIILIVQLFIIEAQRNGVFGQRITQIILSRRSMYT